MERLYEVNIGNEEDNSRNNNNRNHTSMAKTRTATMGTTPKVSNTTFNPLRMAGRRPASSTRKTVTF